MKTRTGHEVRRSWWRAWIKQIAVMLPAGLAASASISVGAALYGALMWLAIPLAGGWTAYRAVRGGLLNYLSWIAPPACLYAAHYALWRYAPPAGPALLCAFIALVGAAAGEVKNANQRANRR